MRGHIRKRGNGYQITVEVGKDPKTGKRKQKSVGGFKTPKEAERALAELITHIDKGQYFVSEKMFLKNYLDRWMEQYGKLNLSPKTYKTYSDLIRWYIVPEIGMVELEELKPFTLQSLYTDLQTKKGLSGSTALHCHNIIHTALKHAVQWQIIHTNVADNVEKPKRTKSDMTVLDIEEVNLLLSELDETSLFIPTALAIMTGMRRSEILGLKWDNVDLKKGIIYIKNQLQRIEGSLELVPVKTDASNRNVLLLDYIIEILKDERKKQIEYKTMLGDNYHDNNFVCCQGDGRPYDPDYISRHFLRKMTKLSQKLEIPRVRFHDLRHTHATLLLKAGVNSKIVAERLGHTKVSMTLDTYTHVLPDMQKEAVEKLENAFKNESRCQNVVIPLNSDNAQ